MLVLVATTAGLTAAAVQEIFNSLASSSSHVQLLSLFSQAGLAVTSLSVGPPIISQGEFTTSYFILIHCGQVTSLENSYRSHIK